LTPIPFFHFFWPACIMALIAIKAADLVGWLQREGWDG
jgi:hypothetical protein